MGYYDDLFSAASSDAGASPAAPAGGYYDNLFGKPEPAQVQSSVISASFLNADKEAEKQRLVRDLKAKLGEDWSPAALDPAEAQRRLKVVENDHALRNSPRLAENFLNPEFASIAHDDVQALSGIEQVTATINKYGLGAIKNLAQGGAYRLSGGVWGATAAPFELLGIDSVGRYARKMEAANKADYERLMQGDGPDDWLFRDVMSGLQSAGQNLYTMPFGLAKQGSEAIMLGIMGLTTFGSSYAKGRNEGLSPLQATNFGLEDATAEVVTEKYLGLAGFLKNVKAGASAGRLFAYELFKELPGELAATTWQNFNEWANVNPDKSIKEYLAEQPEAYRQTIIATLVGGGAQIGAVKSIDKVLSYVDGRDAEAKRAEQFSTLLGEWSKLAEASRLRERDVASAQGYFQSLLDEGRDAVFITPEALAQSGMAEQIAAALPEVRDQLQAAAEAGTDIRLPIADLIASVPGDALNQAILPHVSETPGGFTQTTAQEYMQSDRAKQLERIVEKTLQEQANDDAFKQSQAAVKQAILDNLNAVGRFTAEKNEADAMLASSYAAVRAAQLGMLPEQFFAKHMVTVQGESVLGEAYDQNGVLNLATPERMQRALDQGYITESQWKDLRNGVQREGMAQPGQSSTEQRGDSRAGDGNPGRLQRFYHGTADDVGAFDLEHPNRKDTGWLGNGVYLSDDPELANTYANIKGGNAAPNVMPLTVRLKNPFIADLAFKQKMARLSKEGVASVTARLQALGHDGVVLNFNDDTSEVVVFDPAAVRSVNAEFDPNRAGETDLLAQSAQPRMMAVHNLSADNLIFADQMGGLAVPSVGVVTDQAGAVDGFGEITLIGQRALVDPANERVFSSDAYSARFPKAEWPKAKTAGAQKLVDSIRAIATEFDDAGLIYETWDNMINTPDAGKVIEKWLQSNAIKAMFLRERGIDVEKVFDRVYMSSGLTVEQFNAVRDQLAVINRQENDSQYDTPERTALIQQVSAMLEENYAALDEETRNKLIGRVTKQIAFYLGKDMAAVDQGPRVNQWETSQRMAEQIDPLASEFKQWVEGKVLPNFGKPFIKVNGKKAPYTLANIVKVMADPKVRGKEKTMTYGAGQARAASSIEFSDLEQMRAAAQSMIIDPDQYEDAKAETEKKLDAYRTAVIEYTALRDWRGKPDTWEALDASMRAIAKFLTGKTKDVAAMKKALRSEDFDVAKIPAEVIDQAIEAANALLATPVPYFEAKPQRAVTLDEFAGAVVPSDTPQQVRDILAKHGIQVAEYADRETRNDVARQLAAELSAQGQETLFQNGANNRGSFNPATNIITLLKGADLSTFLHESGHYFFETDIKLAGEIAQEARIHGYDTLTEGEKQILADVSALLSWHGIQGSIDQQLAQWATMDFEEKRTYHERTAESFEHYLFDGKAPSIELQAYFQKFRAWLLNVYRSVKDFLAGNPEAGKLNDEVRAVFDRMLATTEQIKLAEQARSMLPLFASAEQAGMTPDEFAAYQATGLDASQAAIEELQAKGMRDMQWQRNYRAKVLRQLQRQAKEERNAVQMDARRQVMSEPVYRAWQFLTAKLTADDKIETPKPPKSDPNTLDETMDSLFVAIAKLGGLNKEEVVGTWGIDPADKPASGIFGKPLWRIEGGLSIDGMREALAQYGYVGEELAEFEEKFKAELRGDTQYSNAYAPEQFMPEGVANPAGLTAGRFALQGLQDIGLPVEIINHLKALKMTAKDGLHPDLVAEMFGFTSGDELTRTLAAAEAPKDAIEGLTDRLMLERHGELATPDAIERAADKAIHNEVRARMVATELGALEKATGKPKTLTTAAKQYAAAMIARLKVRNIRPGQYAAAEVRAAKAAVAASKSGDTALAAAEKRNQLVNLYATRAAYDAQDEIAAGVRYLKKFDGEYKNLDADYLSQIQALLARFDLRQQSLKAIDRKTSLAAWIEAQREQGLEPDVPDALVDEAFRKSYKDMTLEELRGLIDTVKQIEHLGRLKHKLLTAKDQREYEAVRDEITASIEANAGDREAKTRTPDTVLGKSLLKMRQFWASHIKSATWARIMDGGKDGGPVWEYFIRSANERGDLETTMRAAATQRLSEILAPLFAPGKMTTKTFFPSLNRSLTREARIALALNVGNEGNLQRLLGGEGWTMAQIQPVLQSLTAAEWQAVQQIWDHFESYRPEIGAKEKRVYGKEPQWVEPTPFAMTTADGQTLNLRGGYYPIKYDPMASQRAEEHADAEGAQRQLKGAYTSATTRRSFTKTRAEEVSGRPLLYTLAGVYSGVNDVIHDLAWHEWLIDANRLLRSQSIDQAIRSAYGPEVKAQFKKWAADIAEGDKASSDATDLFFNYMRQSVSVAGLGFNVVSALIQPLGITQSIVRVGPTWVARGIQKYLAHPVALTREVNAMSDFMLNRARTRNRELNELRNQVEGQTKTKELVGKYAYFLMMRFQQMVDVPTWWGAYEKAIGEGNDETRAIALADQAVIDSQGGGMLKDQAGIERVGAGGKLFTVFYSFMNTALGLGVVNGMTEKSRAKQAANYALLYVVPAILGTALKAAIIPGDSGDDDPEKIAKKLLAAQIDYLMGLMVGVREFADVAKTLAGANDMGRDYQGPAGLRLVADAGKFATQLYQGDMDDALRKSFINLIGDLFGLPSAQINRTITGAEALAEGETENPAALVFGFQTKH